MKLITISIVMTPMTLSFAKVTGSNVKVTESCSSESYCWTFQCRLASSPVKAAE